MTKKNSIERENLVTTILILKGIHCASCVTKIEAKIGTLNGVHSVTVNLASAKATVKYDAHIIPISKIIKNISGLGYQTMEPTANKQIILKVVGMDNAHCISIVGSALDKLSGVVDKELLPTQKAIITYNSSLLSDQDITKTISDVGYKNYVESEKSVDKEKEEREHEIHTLKRKLIISSVLGLPLLYFAMAPHVGLPVFSNLTLLVLLQFLLTTPIMIVGYEFFTRGFRSVVKTRTANMDTLIALGTGTAYTYSVIATIFIFTQSTFFGAKDIYFEVAGLLIVFILLGRYLEAVAKGKTSEAVKKLMGLQAKTATVQRKGKEVQIPIDQVVMGDAVVVKPGQKIPLDGQVITGHSWVDESMISGESLPVQKKKGSKVIGSTMNKSGSFTFKVTKVGQDTVLAQIIAFIERAQGSKAPIQKFADVVSSYFVPIVLAIGVISVLVWILVGMGFLFALTIFISVVIIACPCALGLATPTAIMMGTGKGAQQGILIKNADTLQAAGNIDTIVFDKTGTITKGKPVVTDIISASKLSQEKLLGIAGSLEQGSEHALGESILTYAKEKKSKFQKVSGFKALSGYGIEATIGKEKYYFGNAKLMNRQSIVYSDISEQMHNLEQQGKTVMLLATTKKLLGVIAVADTVKETSAQAVSILKEMGITVYMITGDNSRTAQAIAKQVGIDHVFADVLPQDKAKHIISLQKKGVVAMVGDGINDAPALSQADVGIAVGSGTDIAIESADIVLVKNDIKDVELAIKLSRYTMRKIKQNLFWAFAYNVASITIAAGLLYPFTGFLLNPVIAGAAMAFSSVSVLANSLTMKFKRL